MLKTRGVGARQTSDTVTLPAAVGGWNARDAYSKMDIKDAVILINMLPRTLDIVSRSGYVQWATGLGGAVESVFAYNAANGTSLLFGAADGKIFDCTTQGAVDTAKVSGLTSNRWQTVNFSTSAGNYLVAVNGVDKLQLFNGTTWAAIDGVSTPAITGVATTALATVNVYAQRLWFAEVDKLKVWYLPVGAISGAATSIDLGNAFRLGGYIQAIGTITLDAGAGSDDHIAFVTSRGEVAVYHGTDPSSSSAWARIGVYRIGAPMGRRCLENYGGDLLVLSLEGLGLLSQLVLSSQINSRQNMLTDKIQYSISKATTLAKSNYGWDIQIFPRDNLLWINVPFSDGSQQYAMNTITGAWCQITGWNALNWTLKDDDPYFGSKDGFVGKAFINSTDNGDPIQFEVLSSFYDYDNDAQLKQFLLSRLTLMADRLDLVRAVKIGCEINYQIRSDLSSHEFYGEFSGAKWGVSRWGIDRWETINVPIADWIGLNKVGYAMALHAKGSLNNAISWRSYDVVYQSGGII